METSLAVAIMKSTIRRAIYTDVKVSDPHSSDTELAWNVSTNRCLLALAWFHVHENAIYPGASVNLFKMINFSSNRQLISKYVSNVFPNFKGTASGQLQISFSWFYSFCSWHIFASELSTTHWVWICEYSTISWAYFWCKAEQKQRKWKFLAKRRPRGRRQWNFEQIMYKPIKIISARSTITHWQYNICKTIGLTPVSRCIL